MDKQGGRKKEKSIKGPFVLRLRQWSVANRKKKKEGGLDPVGHYWV